MKNEALVTVLVADDQPAVRSGLVMYLKMEPDFKVLGEAANGQEAISKALQLAPDLVLMDVDMPGELDGIAATHHLIRHSPGIDVVILTIHDDPLTREKARQAGAAAFVPKGNLEELLQTLRTVSVKRTRGPKKRRPGSYNEA